MDASLVAALAAFAAGFAALAKGAEVLIRRALANKRPEEPRERRISDVIKITETLATSVEHQKVAAQYLHICLELISDLRAAQPVSPIPSHPNTARHRIPKLPKP